MRRTLITLLCLLPSLCGAQNYSDQISLARGGPFDDSPAQITHQGEIDYSVRFYVSDFFDQDTIFAFTEVANRGEAEVKYAFSVAYFDAEGRMVAAARHATTLKPGVKTQLGGMLSEVQAGEWQGVASYQYTVTKL